MREADPELISLATWSLVHGLSHLIINGAVDLGDWAAIEQVTEGVLRLLGDGIHRPG